MKRIFLLISLLVIFVNVGAQDGVPWVPQVQILDSNGDPLSGGKVYTYISGTTTDQATYTDSTLGTPNANPVVLDSAGRASIWLDETLSYRIDVKTSADVLVYSVDNITSQYASSLMVIGDGTAADARISFSGNAQTYYMGLDDSEDELVVGLGSVLGTTPAFSIDTSQVTTFYKSFVLGGVSPNITIGDADAEDTSLTYDGNTQDFYICLDDTADDLILGLGNACGTTGIIYLDENQDVGIGGASAGAKLDVTGNVFIDGAADEIQLTVQGNGTQTSDILVVENSAGTDLFVVDTTGVGIQTASPEHLLHVYDSADDLEILVETDKVGGEALVAFRNDAKEWNVGVNSGDAFQIYDADNSIPLVSITSTSTTRSTLLQSDALGNDNAGPNLSIGRNSSTGTEGPAPGTIDFQDSAAGANYVWSDNSAAPGKLRIHSAAPTGSSGSPSVSETAGTVVGDQTSWHELKENIEKLTPFEERDALRRVLATDTFRFDMEGDHREAGLVIYPEDIGSWYSYNDDLDNQQIPSLDDRSIIGHLVASVKELHRKIEAVTVLHRSLTGAPIAE